MPSALVINPSQPREWFILFPLLHQNNASLLKESFPILRKAELLKSAMAEEDRLCTTCFLCALALLVILLMPCVVPFDVSSELYLSPYCVCARQLIAVLVVLSFVALHMWD
jgi:hypothetical protein